MFKLLIVDDHQLIINSLISIIVLNYPDKFDIEQARSLNEALLSIDDGKEEIIYDLVILDLRLPKGGYGNCTLNSGLELGDLIRKNQSKTKILIFTGYFEEVVLHNVFERINPEGFLIKGDIGEEEINDALFRIVFENGCYYSNKIKAYFQLINGRSRLKLDTIDIEILKEISQGCKLGELMEFIPLSKSGIEKRIRRLRDIFEVDSGSNRELIIKARTQGILF